MASPRTDIALSLAAVVVLKKANWRNGQIAAALGISPIALEHRITRMRRKGLQGPFRDRPKNHARCRPEDVPIAGEVWRDVPFRMLRLSSAGRVASMKTGLLVRPFNQSFDGALGVNYEASGKRGTITLANLAREARGEPPKDISRRYTAREDDLVRRARTVDEALVVLKDRSRFSVQGRARKLGHQFDREWTPDIHSHSGPGRTDVDAIEAIIPLGWPRDVRDGVKSEIALLQLEHFPGDLNQAFRLGLRRYNRAFGATWLVSLDAPNRTTGLAMIDLVSSDDPHF